MKGGSFVGYAQHTGGPRDLQDSVAELLDLEKEYKLDKPETIRKMFERLESVKMEVRNLISNLKKNNKSIAGFGAARAGTTLLNYFDIGDQLNYLVDDNKNKHYKFSPGDKLEVFPASDIYTKNPDYLLILAWLHADIIIDSHKKYLKQGGIILRLFPGVEQIKY